MFSAGAMARGLRLTRTPEHDGVLVQRLDKTNPLAQLGLRAGDILTGIGETALTEPPTVQRLAALLNRKNVRIFLVRDNKPHIVHASLQR
jgi:S1-C subfamily serine protease